MRSLFRLAKTVVSRALSLAGTVVVLALSLLPLSALLLFYPALNPQESVLTDAVSAKSGWGRHTLRRLGAVAIAVVVLVALLAIAVEVVSRLPLPEKGSFGIIARTLLPAPEVVLPPAEEQRKEILAAMPPEAREFWTTPLYAKLPSAMVEHWPFVSLMVYVLDLGVLLLIGKVPLTYNLRNVRVRWKTNAMTAVAFMCVIALLTFLLAFVNGMNNLTENSGVPGNVFVLSDGSTDEIFSNLGYGELDNVERVEVDEEQLFDATGKPVLDGDKELWRAVPPIRVKQIERDGRKKYLASRETYYSINMPVPNSDPPRRRFVQLRTIEDPLIAAKVHNVELYPGGEWFSKAGVDDNSRIQCVLGDGIAGTLGADNGKKRLEVGDEFILGEMKWVVTGVMKSEGTTFGSEIWALRFNRIYQPFGKDKYTTLVMRTDQDTKEASRAFANYLTKRYTQQKLKAFSEPDYYAELTKTNNTFLTAIIIVCLVMALGGVFGMMTTMFASIAQRIKDIGVLRLLGFKRWQVMVSFLLESLAVAVIGGAAGIALAWLLADGKSSVSTLSSGGGGPGGKSVALKINVDAEVMAMGMLFTLAMGRLGGLVPALSAMRMKILDSLR
jgi:ABC-type lipoprotein release transport system permease subunit